MDNPDAGLHPTSAAALAGVLGKFTGQVTIATHSPAMLDGLGDPAALVYVENTPDGTGTKAVREQRPEEILRAMREPGAGMAQCLQGRGFGA